MGSKGKVGAIILGLILIVGLIGTIISIERIPTGYVGVVYSMNGGVTGETLSQGWHLVFPTKKVEEFTISNEQLILSKDEREGSKSDDSFLVATSDNANISISFQMSYRFDASTIVDTYTKFRGLNGDEIVQQRLRTVLKSKISEVTKEYTMMDVYSEKRGEIDSKLTESLNEELMTDFGIEVLDAGIIDVHPDEQLEKSIQDRVTAMQNKQQKEAEQEAIIVEAETKLIQAENEAQVKITEANAIAEANRIISQSITQELIDMETVEARKVHGWVTTKGGTPIVDATE